MDNTLRFNFDKKKKFKAKFLLGGIVIYIAIVALSIKYFHPKLAESLRYYTFFIILGIVIFISDKGWIGEDKRKILFAAAFFLVIFPSIRLTFSAWMFYCPNIVSIENENEVYKIMFPTETYNIHEDYDNIEIYSYESRYKHTSYIVSQIKIKDIDETTFLNNYENFTGKYIEAENGKIVTKNIQRDKIKLTSEYPDGYSDRLEIYFSFPYVTIVQLRAKDKNRLYSEYADNFYTRIKRVRK